MMNHGGIIETAAMTVEERLGALIASCNRNNREIQKGINELCDTVKVHDDLLTDCMADISELFGKNKKKAGKFGVILMAIAGIAYIIKNECDKADMKNALIAQDKRRACNYSDLEDEGETTDPIGI